MELNPEQRRAVEAVRGPVCILAGAGTGKTTTITHRLAHQVASGAFAANELLAVTFTEKAGGELRRRLAALGAGRVRAGTFHAAALRQLRHFAPASIGKILPTKALLVRQVANRLPGAYKFRPAADLAAEIEWAKNRRISPGDYLASLGAHEPPLPADLMLRVYREYEERKLSSGLVDFEDLLERAVGLFETDERAAETFRGQYRAFTVDEYQDVNHLQQRLLDLWLGERTDLCVVGDDYQSIYAFTGAGPEHLLGVPARFPDALVVRLEENYRSSPQVLALANRLVPSLGGAPKELRPVRADGPEPSLRSFGSAADEGAAIVAALRGLDLPFEAVAILCRTNARLSDYEELLHDADIPFQGVSLLARDAARRLLRGLDRTDPTADATEMVRAAALEAGWDESPPETLGERELVRQADLARLVALANDWGGDVGAYITELRRRFEPGSDGARGVHLLTLHRSKGLEFEAVFLPRLEAKELPARQARTPEQVNEERRLLYVGLTRAKRLLHLSWSGPPSPFLRELGAAASNPRKPSAAEWTPLGETLRAWRAERAKHDNVPAYVVFHDKVLVEIADRRPADLAALGRISGVGPAKLERYGSDLLSLLER